MNIGFDHETCKAGCADEESPGFPTAPDWTDLRARLFAAYQVRTVLSGDADRVRLRTRGSFAGGTANLLNTYETGSRPVNLDISTNRKPGAVKVTSVAGADKTGERG